MDYELERGKGGLSGEGEWYFYGQETACEKFPAWRGEDDIHGDGKLLAKSFLVRRGEDGTHDGRNLSVRVLQ